MPMRACRRHWRKSELFARNTTWPSTAPHSVFVYDQAASGLNWQQGFNDGNTGLIVGRCDPNDYMNVLGYVNPWMIFSNLTSNLDASVAFSD